MAKYLFIQESKVSEFDSINKFKTHIDKQMKEFNIAFKLDCSGNAPKGYVIAPTIKEYITFMEFIDENNYDDFLY